MREIAYAKINLALHVRRWREDGYHEIETLFAFVDQGDLLVARGAQTDAVETVGEFAGNILEPRTNLAMRALALLPRPSGLAITLEKRLPVAAGLGGGSADAAAVFRIVEAAHGLPDDWRDRATRLGADVPACVRSEMAVGRGTGTQLEPIENDLAGGPVLLVNPRELLPTGPVFARWDGVDLGPLPEGPASIIAKRGRNDLQAPALALCPAIGRVLDALRRTAPDLTRMSGSGASCFALYPDFGAREAAAAELRRDHPDWWFLEGRLR